ncbi:branched-chain amino acid aminotransferase [Saccharothrix longispora]|uniref:branched-chain amino acid aminotransferase n=1 Tax=Saccharothrix longispora TaxID=33920 RepID=UPI00398D46CC
MADEAVRRRCATPAFGTVLTEHMVTMTWSAERGWHDGAVRPYAPEPVDPATAGLHYGQVVFEGLKAFHQADGTVAAFRPALHAKRFRTSARRLVMPELPEALFVDAIRALVDADRRWVPTEPDRSLYLRPLLYAADVSLALRPASTYRFVVLASVTENFFGSSGAPVSVWVSTRYSRAAPGGTGSAKCAGNYAGAFAGQREAVEHGCDQVLWLDAAERRWIEEMGGMNIFWVTRGRNGAVLVTPALTDTLLPGVTRDSLLTVAHELGIATRESRVAFDDFTAAVSRGEVTEAFACGTAAVVTPIGRIRAGHGEWHVGDGGIGPVAGRLRDALIDLQRGRVPDPRGWLVHCG